MKQDQTDRKNLSKSLVASIAGHKKFSSTDIQLLEIDKWTDVDKIRCCTDLLGCWNSDYVELIDSRGFICGCNDTNEKRAEHKDTHMKWGHLSEFNWLMTSNNSIHWATFKLMVFYHTSMKHEG